MIEAEFKLLKSMKPKDYQSQEHNYEPLGNIINDFFSEVGKAVAEQCKDVDLGNYEGKSFLTDQERCQRYCQWKKALPEPTFSLDDWSKLMFGKCFPMLNLWGKKSADGLMSHFGVDTSLFPVVNEHVADTIKELTIKLCADTLATSQYLVEDSIERLKAEINSGIFTGDGSRELVNRVQEIFNDKKRAYNIAQTEESRIRHSAEATSIKETGLKMGKKFLLDTLNACDQCRAVKAKYPGVVPMETLWSNNAYTREAGGIPIHPSCMCSQSYSLEGEE
jgi:hypothetical protein